MRERQATIVKLSFFATDLHGSSGRYDALLREIARDEPRAVFLGGDLLPHGALPAGSTRHRCAGFLDDYLAPALSSLRKRMGADYPAIFAILGNDDGRADETTVIEMEAKGLWTYVHQRWADLDGFPVCGYAFVPPTPFQIKDWERYDVSRYVPPGAVSPEEGFRTVAKEPRRARYATIARDLEDLAGDRDLESSVFLFHTPPADTTLDRAGLDGRMIDHVPLDVHVGSVAVRRFIEKRQPMLTLHGHIHESTRLTGKWSDRIGRTLMFNGAHDGPELSLVKFDLESPGAARRVLL